MGPQYGPPNMPDMPAWQNQQLYGLPRAVPELRHQPPNEAPAAREVRLLDQARAYGQAVDRGTKLLPGDLARLAELKTALGENVFHFHLSGLGAKPLDASAALPSVDAMAADFTKQQALQHGAGTVAPETELRNAIAGQPTSSTTAQLGRFKSALQANSAHLQASFRQLQQSLTQGNTDQADAALATLQRYTGKDPRMTALYGQIKEAVTAKDGARAAQAFTAFTAATNAAYATSVQHRVQSLAHQVGQGNVQQAGRWVGTLWAVDHYIPAGLPADVWQAAMSNTALPQATKDAMARAHTVVEGQRLRRLQLAGKAPRDLAAAQAAGFTTEATKYAAHLGRLQDALELATQPHNTPPAHVDVPLTGGRIDIPFTGHQETAGELADRLARATKDERSDLYQADLSTMIHQLREAGYQAGTATRPQDSMLGEVAGRVANAARGVGTGLVAGAYGLGGQTPPDALNFGGYQQAQEAGGLLPGIYAALQSHKAGVALMNNSGYLLPEDQSVLANGLRNAAGLVAMHAAMEIGPSLAAHEGMEGYLNRTVPGVLPMAAAGLVAPALGDAVTNLPRLGGLTPAAAAVLNIGSNTAAFAAADTLSGQDKSSFWQNVGKQLPYAIAFGLLDAHQYAKVAGTGTPEGKLFQFLGKDAPEDAVRQTMRAAMPGMSTERLLDFQARLTPAAERHLSPVVMDEIGRELTYRARMAPTGESAPPASGPLSLSAPAPGASAPVDAPTFTYRGQRVAQVLPGPNANTAHVVMTDGTEYPSARRRELLPVAAASAPISREISPPELPLQTAQEIATPARAMSDMAHPAPDLPLMTASDVAARPGAPRPGDDSLPVMTAHEVTATQQAAALGDDELLAQLKGHLDHETVPAEHQALFTQAYARLALHEHQETEPEFLRYIHCLKLRA